MGLSSTLARSSSQLTPIRWRTIAVCASIDRAGWWTQERKQLVRGQGVEICLKATHMDTRSHDTELGVAFGSAPSAGGPTRWCKNQGLATIVDGQPAPGVDRADPGEAAVSARRRPGLQQIGDPESILEENRHVLVAVPFEGDDSSRSRRAA